MRHGQGNMPPSKCKVPTTAGWTGVGMTLGGWKMMTEHHANCGARLPTFRLRAQVQTTQPPVTTYTHTHTHTNTDTHTHTNTHTHTHRWIAIKNYPELTFELHRDLL